MHKSLHTALASIIVAGSLLLSPLPGAAQESRLAAVPAVHCPTLLLKHWQQSSQKEKLAFLFGFATMLEMEREWQGQPALPITSSINASWAKGLAGVSVGDMVKAVDAYIAENPDQTDKSVIEVLGRVYVRPKLTQEERAQAGQRYEQIKARR